MAVDSELWSRWRGRWPAARAVFDELAVAYTAPERAYHNLEHLRHMFTTLDRLAGLAADIEAVELAVWFHDVVYDPRAKDNEAKSAAFAAARLPALGVSADTATRVGELILLTRTHQPAQDDGDGQVLCDADLAILGSPTGYDAYAAAIRQEYGWVPEAEYRAGRIAVLESFLQRPVIYHTELLRREGEEQARANIRREIEALRSPGQH